MLLPASVPQKLTQRYSVFSNEKQLTEELLNHPNDLVEFLTYCCDDETWCESYSHFMQHAITALTAWTLDLRLSPHAAKSAALAMQPHYSILASLMPLNIHCRLSDGEVAINSFFFQAISPYFFDIIHNHYLKDSSQLTMPNLSGEEFKTIQEYIYTGDVKELWRESEKQLTTILEHTSLYRLPDLSKQCEIVLINYLNRDNIFFYLTTSYMHSWELIKGECCNKISDLGFGITLKPLGPQELSCEIHEVTERSMETFEMVKPYVTELVSGKEVMENDNFVQQLHTIDNLKSLDLGKSRAFTPLMKDIPPSLFELNLSGATWLNNENFRALIAFSPSIVKLNVASCTLLSSTAWGELLKLKRLTALNLSNCLQINSKEFQLILNSVRNLQELDLSSCKELEEEAFHLLALSALPITHLNLSRTELNDSALLKISSHLQTLTHLNLTRCQKLTEEGISAALNHLPFLREVFIAFCSIASEKVSNLRAQFPQVTIHFELTTI